MTGRLSIRAVVEAVSDVTGFATADIIGPRRHRELVRARQLAMWCCKRYCPHMSYPQIGRRFGARDHTTVLHGVNKIEAEIEAQGKDPVLEEIELVLAPAAQALEVLQIQAADPDPMEVAERAMTEHGVARITYDEIRAMASFVLAAIVGGRLIIDPPEEEARPISDILILAVREVLKANRTLEDTRFGRGEAAAMNGLAEAMKELRQAFSDLGYSLNSQPVFKTRSNTRSTAPRKEAEHGRA